ncbi:hypothetical protein AB4K05_00735 [Kluyvera sp. STS39-E]|uniref:hypothetical protein n=1 Tax=Kluyvera sp. STS39-E TaxID=3234748 RepID=UPI0034C6B460
MSKRNKKKQHAMDIGTTVPVPTHDAPTTFGFEEMLSELEAIVIEAESRLAEEAA